MSPLANPSPQQIEFFQEIQHGNRNIFLDARAGCGKTTTVIEAVNYAPEHDIMLCAFNKVIAEELKARLRNPRAQARTLHSIGYGIVVNRWGKTQIDERRGHKLAAKATGMKNPTREIVNVIADLAAKGKNIAPFATFDDLFEIAEDFDIEPDNRNISRDEEHWTIEQVINCALAAMEAATHHDGSIDFDDMIYLPVRCKWIRPKFGMVIVDECQDMNPTQIELALGISRGRVIIVGDPFQAIYKFRGADPETLAKLEKRLNAKRMSLTTTYRCPKSVVAIAQTLVPDFHAADTAPEGIIRDINIKALNSDVRPGDFILSRKNAPLARICLSLLREGKKAIIRGREFGAGFIKLVERLEAENIPELMIALATWENNNVEKLIAENASDSRIEYVHDQAATIRELSEGLATIPELIKRMSDLFSDNGIGSTIICSTVHKAKGLESERVFGLVDTLYPRQTNSQEERNIEYVLITRAKNEYVRVEGGN